MKPSRQSWEKTDNIGIFKTFKSIRELEVPQIEVKDFVYTEGFIIVDEKVGRITRTFVTLPSYTTSMILLSGLKKSNIILTWHQLDREPFLSFTCNNGEGALTFVKD